MRNSRVYREWSDLMPKRGRRADPEIYLRYEMAARNHGNVRDIAKSLDLSNQAVYEFLGRHPNLAKMIGYIPRRSQR